MLRKYSKWILIGFLAASVVAGVRWWTMLPTTVTPVTIEPGMSAYQAAALLHAAGVISSPKAFMFVVRVSGNAKRIKAGTYALSPRDSLFKVLSALTKGRAVYVKITVPEGFTAAQIAQRLHEAHISDENKFLALVNERKLEGYLFPETYYFETHSPETLVADRMVKTFDVNFTPAMKERANSLKKLGERNIVILASIIEKEAVTADERPLISAVFHNRLKKRMYLESCATILYALGKHKDRLTYKDLQVESSYNTYRHYGLPPGPICNPGKASLDAALYPADTDDLFFVVKGSGTHTFSRYYDEHLKHKKERKKRLKKLQK